MDDSQVTRISLLLRLQGADTRQAWSDFIDLYSPIIYRFARRQGLQDADAADLVQDVLISVSKSVCHYDRQRGPFRGWLMGVVRNHLCEFWRKRAREPCGSGDTATLQHLVQSTTEDDLERQWEEEYMRCVFQAAVHHVRGNFEPATWSAFWQTFVEGRSAQDVAASLGISIGAVYIAKCRVLARVKEQVRVLTE